MSVPRVFDPRALRRQRDRRAASILADPFLLDEIVGRLVDRLGDIRRRFGRVLDLGGRHGPLGAALRRLDPEVELVTVDPARALVRHAEGPAVVADLEVLPFADGSFDAVVSAGSLHAINDLPGLLVQLRRCLRPDGLLLVAFPGGDTLIELRRALLAAELATTGGAAPRVAPFVDVRDLGALLQRAGFALPVVDVDRLRLSYADPLRLLGELRGGGEACSLVDRPRGCLRRDVLAQTLAGYERDERGRCPVTVDLLFATAWSPHPDQQRPARRGSGTVNLAQALGVDPGILDGTKRREDG